MSKENNKVLVVYFTRSGKTRQVAHWIREANGGDLIELKLVDPYPSGYQAVVDQARKEIDAGVKPELKTKIENIGQYDRIYIGTPNWWSTMAPPVATFLSSYDFSGKVLIPFVTHGGGGLAACASDMKKLAPDATFRDALAVRDSRVEGAKPEVVEWTKKNMDDK
ncbi:MAG: flavodoxin [Lentisphaeria bacterium]|nr:flavodoxin [Lentisphaeria bacterium]